jgi:aconitate hydratase
MGAEIGATTSTFGYDDSMRRYLAATGRQEVVDAADKIAEHLTGDAEVYANPEKYFDQVIEINLSELEPHINGPFTPDRGTPVSKMKAEALEANEWPMKVEWGLIGSCTNSSYEDMARAASIVEQAVAHGITPKAEFGINPGSEQVRYTIERDGIIATFEKWEQKYLRMLVDLVSVNGIVKVLKNKKKIQLYILSTVTSLKERMETQIHMLLLLHQKWLLRLQLLVI